MDARMSVEDGAREDLGAKQNLSSESLTISQLFAPDTSYSVPVYQRNYAWEASQIEQLLEDVADALRASRADDSAQGYFLGNVVVRKQAPPVGARGDVFSVVDGQQRLTTLALVFTVLRTEGVITTPPGATERLHYESRPRSTATLRLIAEGTDPQAAHRSENLDAGILQAVNVITQHLRGPGFRGQLAEFADFLQHCVSVVRVALPRSTDLNRYFEVMNTRGRQLQQVDIVKARLMAELRNVSGDTQPIDQLQVARELATFAWIWDACADMDRYVQQALTTNDQTLREQLFTPGSWSWLTAKSFADLVTARTHERTTGASSVPAPSGHDDALTLDAAIARYETVATSDAPSGEDPEQFRSTIEFPSFLLHALQVFRQRSSSSDSAGAVPAQTAENADDAEYVDSSLDDKRLIQLFAEEFSDAGAAHVREFAWMLLKVRNLFDAFILKREYLSRAGEDGAWSLRRVTKRKSNDRDSTGYVGTFAAPAQSEDRDPGEAAGRDDARHGQLLLLESMLRVTYTSPRSMHWITLVLRHVARAADPALIHEPELVKVVQSYARGRVRSAFPEEAEPRGFDIPRVVFTYLDYLLLSSDRRGGTGGFAFGFRTSIEHFYPQNPAEERHSLAPLSEDDLHCLGNLALVSVSSNSRFGNLLPTSKAADYNATIEQQSPKLAVMAELTRQAKQWSPEMVRAHHREMVALIREDLRLGEVL